jgi:uncharacterized repeat protein (TIGR01451 family)
MLATSDGNAVGPSNAGDQPALTLTADASPEIVVTGSQVTFTLSITNDGPGIATGATVLDELPRETTFVSCAATGTGVCGGSGRTRRITFEMLMPDATETVTLVAAVACQVRDGEELANTASVHSSAAHASGAGEDVGDADDNEIVFITASNPPPAVVDPTVTPSLPWPADHQMVDVAIGYRIVDNCGPVRVAVSVTRSDVTVESLDEASRDWEVVDAHHVRVRAERSAPATRRIYTISITAVDSANQSSTPQVMTLTVPPLIE